MVHIGFSYPYVLWASSMNFHSRDWFIFTFFFLGYYLTACAGLYLFFHFHTTPAVIWPAAGFALAIVYFGGYRVGLPIFLGQFFAVATFQGFGPVAFISAVAYTTQSLVAVYLLQRVGFEASFEKVRNVLVFIVAALFVTCVAPIISTLGLFASNSLSILPLLNVSRAWAAGIFSVLVVTPFITTWYPWPKLKRSHSDWAWIGGALALLTVNNILVFWTSFPQYVGIAIIFFLPAVLIFFALSFHPRWLTLAVLYSAIVGLAGSIVAHPTAAHLSDQLLADEIYLGLVAAIFYVFAAVVEERRVAFSNLKKLYEITAEADTAKNEFIAILAHELRNPLAPILSSLELLRLQTQSDESLAIIHNISEHSMMIRRLLDDLLDIARLTQKKLNLQKEIVRLQDIVRLSIASVQELARARRLTLSVDVPEEDIFIHVDPVRTKQILINLLNNACKYTEPGGSILLSCRASGGMLRIAVKDTGIGIAAQTMPQLFLPFKLGRPSQHGTGLGVGLFLTKHIVEMHGGRIEAHSDGPDTGSTFIVTIPLLQQTPALPKSASIEQPSTDAKRILIVDDNAPAANGLQKLLTHYGHTPHTVYTGYDAFTATTNFIPAVILLDIGLPDMSGYDVARQLRASGYSGALVALTGYGQESDRLEAKNAGFNAHLIKPVGISDVLAVLATL